MLHGVLHILIGQVGVDLGGIELFVAQNILEDPDVHLPRLVHQGGGGVA